MFEQFCLACQPNGSAYLGFDKTSTLRTLYGSILKGRAGFSTYSMLY